jgi:hypothetical protein
MFVFVKDGQLIHVAHDELGIALGVVAAKKAIKKLQGQFEAIVGTDNSQSGLRCGKAIILLISVPH